MAARSKATRPNGNWSLDHGFVELVVLNTKEIAPKFARSAQHQIGCEALQRKFALQNHTQVASIVVLIQQRGCNARWPHAANDARWPHADNVMRVQRHRDPKSDRSLNRGIASLVVPNIK